MRRVDWVFLDRDGTINAKAPEGDYIKTPSELRLLPGAASAIRRLNDAAVWVGVVTNQRGIALGRMTEDDFVLVQRSLVDELTKSEARLDAVYHCPHDIGQCDCRKPAPGMLLSAQRDISGLDFSRAAIVGDAASDVEAGRAVGAVTVLVRAADADPPTVGAADSAIQSRPDHVAASIGDAVEWLLSTPPQLEPSGLAQTAGTGE